MKKFLILSLVLFSISFLPAEAIVCFDFNANLRYGGRDGAQNGNIFQLQSFLKDRGYLSVNPTGYFGPLTLKAVKSFQGVNAIPSTGFVGPMTRAFIKKTSCEQIPVTPTPQPEPNTEPSTEQPAVESVPAPVPTPTPTPTPITEPVLDEILSAGSASSLRVRTKNPISITANSVLVAGQVTAGARSGTQTWFELTSNPDAYKLSETKTTPKMIQRSEGDFSAWFTGLNSNTTYYYRACAENTSLGQKICEGTVSFKTLSN